MAVPLVSILIPAYNSERWIAQTLESALTQTWSRKEIILVDDGSRDGTLSVARKFESAGVKVLSQENQGASVARNSALKQAQGDFIQYLDADDLMAPDKIELQIRRLSVEPPHRVASGAWGRFYDHRDNARFVPEPIWSDMEPLEWLITSFGGGYMMANSAWLSPRAVVEKTGAWDETRCPIDDGEYFSRIVLHSSGVAFCPEARVYYRTGMPGTWSKGRNPEMLAATYRAFELCTSRILDAEDSPRARKACAAVFQRYVYDVYPEAPELLRKAEAKVRSFGGSDVPYGGSAKMRLLTGLLGWKAAKRLHKFSNRLRSGFSGNGERKF
jgi:glycosyltransferase involved in cell wall biosynthesis